MSNNFYQQQQEYASAWNSDFCRKLQLEQGKFDPKSSTPDCIVWTGSRKSLLRFLKKCFTPSRPDVK